MPQHESGSEIFGNDPYRIVQTDILEKIEAAGSDGADFRELTDIRVPNVSDIASIKMARSAILELRTLGLVSIDDDFTRVTNIPE